MTCPEDGVHKREGGRGDKVLSLARMACTRLRLAQEILILVYQGCAWIDVVPGGRLHPKMTTSLASGQSGCELCTRTDLPLSSPLALLVSLELGCPLDSREVTAW